MEDRQEMTAPPEPLPDLSAEEREMLEKIHAKAPPNGAVPRLLAQLARTEARLAEAEGLLRRAEAFIFFDACGRFETEEWNDGLQLHGGAPSSLGLDIRAFLAPLPDPPTEPTP